MKELRELTRWVLRQRWDKRPIQTEQWPNGTVIAECLWREPPFQVERAILAPNTIILEHAHPNVDTWEVALSGSGVVQIGRRFFVADENYTHPTLIKSSVWHSGSTTDEGGVWLSIQQWHNCEPTSLLKNWIERTTICRMEAVGLETLGM